MSPAKIGVSDKSFRMLASLCPRKFELPAQTLRDAELLNGEINQIRKDLRLQKQEPQTPA